MLAVKVAYGGLSFVTSVLLTRLLGAAGFGIYAYSLAWVVVLSAPAGLGLDKILVREIAADQVQSAWGRIRTRLLRANRLALLVSLCVLVIAALLGFVLSPQGDQVFLAFGIALFFLPLLNLVLIRQAAMQGLHHVVLGQLPETVIQPLLLIALLFGANWALVGHLTAPWAMGMSVLAGLVALVIGWWLLRVHLPQAAKNAPPVPVDFSWGRSVLPLVLFSSMQIANARIDTLILGAFKGPSAVGVYAVASKGAELITFILGAVVPPLAPIMASLYASGEVERLQQVVTRAARVTVLLSAPIALGFILVGDWYLLFFGHDFVQGRWALAILSVAQFIHVAIGAPGMLLLMTGHEGDAAKSISISVVMNVVLNVLLVPPWGIEGAALATSGSIILWTLLMSVWVYRRIGIRSTVLGKIRIGRPQT